MTSTTVDGASLRHKTAGTPRRRIAPACKAPQAIDTTDSGTSLRPAVVVLERLNVSQIRRRGQIDSDDSLVDPTFPGDLLDVEDTSADEDGGDDVDDVDGEEGEADVVAGSSSNGRKKRRAPKSNTGCVLYKCHNKSILV